MIDINITTRAPPVHEYVLGFVPPEVSPYVHLMNAFLLVLIYIFGVVENGIILAIFAKNKNLRSATNTFIIAMALGDFSLCFFGIPLSSTSSMAGRWIWGDIGCMIEGFIVYFIGMANMYILMAVSLDRYLVISRPLMGSKITVKIAILAVIACVAGGLFWTVVPFFGWSRYTPEGVGTTCSVTWMDKDVATTSYNISIFIFCYLVPVGTMVVAYYKLLETVRNVAKNTVWDMNSRMARKNLRIERKMAKSFMIIVGRIEIKLPSLKPLLYTCFYFFGREIKSGKLLVSYPDQTTEHNLLN
ncbi:hypothetical protein CHS0354_041830 [Potamilus streckersoni]|uniref:G-protein coupled receptors family 1 profile domain-containing protein n=1 Tax=Potamilus streckersoni TaxID=2493646 RepID=A0AAE0T1Q9_9BIVA|nr:hypothetical protein CHS0354_041830 [Potamilus streckersoni]